MKAFFLLPLLASTQSVAAEFARPAMATPVASTGGLLQITFSLLLVLAAIMALAWLLRRMNLTQQGTGNLLRVIGSVAIGQRERVVLVEVDDTWLLIGVGPGQIRTLHTLPKNEAWQAEPQGPANSEFSRLLASIIKPRNGKNDAP